jgi:hypothetical protein
MVRDRFALDPAWEGWNKIALCQAKGEQGERWRRAKQVLNEDVPSAVVKDVALAQNVGY